jgi:hypothetical protein
MNLYGHANGDPVNFSDPFGLYADRQGEDSADDENMDDDDSCRQDAASEACKAKESEEQARVMTCVEANTFSAMVRSVTGSETAGAVAEIVEFAAPVSSAAAMYAYSMKSSRDFWRGSGKNWASGFNMAAKKLISSAGGGPRLLGHVRRIGDFGSVPTAILGAFTTAYNGTVVLQCAAGVIN